MSLERLATRLSIGYELIALHKVGPKLWRFNEKDHAERVELAALRYWEAGGWTGCASEGGLFLTLIKAASFEQLPKNHANTFIESIYHWESGGCPELAIPRDRMLANVRSATSERIAANFQIIVGQAKTPFYYPGVQLSHVLRFKELLGEKLFVAAELFAAEPYEYRRGWPDLIVWRGNELRLVEVKAPGDALHASQKKMITGMVKPLGLNMSILEVVAAEEERGSTNRCSGDTANFP